MNDVNPKGPVSFDVHVSRLPHKGLPVTIRADAAQRAALADEHGLVSIESYSADLLVTSWKRHGIKIAGRVQADVTQACVVTLEPVAAHIDEPVEGLFLPDDSRLGRQGFGDGGEIMLEADGPDGPEIFSGDTIDAGALAEQFFGLALDPYPRKRGVAVDAATADEAADEPVESEFQKKLRSLLGKP